MENAEARAKWIGVATYEASNHSDFPFRDSEAARWRANAAKRARENAKNGIDGRRRKTGPPVEVAADEGGHMLEQVASGKGWFCTTCRARAKVRNKLATTRCGKAGTKAWLGLGGTGVQVRGDGGWNSWGSGQAGGRQHKRARSGTIVWCTACGCFAETRANGLSGECIPPPTSQGSSGRRSQLNRLLSNRHPVTLEALPPAVRIDGSGLVGSGTYLRLTRNGDSPDEHFKPYIPTCFPPAAPVSRGNAVAIEHELRRGRLVAKQVLSKKAERRLKRAQINAAASDLIKSFQGTDDDGDDVAGECKVCDSDREMREFWNEVCQVPDRAFLSQIESPQRRNMHSRGMKSSRLTRLGC